MAQLRMIWENDGKAAVFPTLPQNITLGTFHALDGALSAWQDIVRYLDKEGNMDTGGNYYKETMLDYPNYSEELCFFVLVDEKPAATITVICNKEKREGYIHMVACKPEFRGMGIGKLLNDVALYALKNEDMETAYLTTDDWRIPAIKSYLKAGFTPDLTTEPDFKERWQKIYDIIKEPRV